MPSADQVPVKSPHSTMRWHKWVVLIAGSTGIALRAVYPPNRRMVHFSIPAYLGEALKPGLAAAAMRAMTSSRPPSAC
jgi:hypothetical protein